MISIVLPKWIYEPAPAMSATRLDVKKTYKLYIGGKFPRSETRGAHDFGRGK